MGAQGHQSLNPLLWYPWPGLLASVFPLQPCVPPCMTVVARELCGPEEGKAGGKGPVAPMKSARPRRVGWARQVRGLECQTRKLGETLKAV